MPNIDATGGLKKFDVSGPKNKPDGKITESDLMKLLSGPKAKENKEALLSTIADEAIKSENKGEKAKSDKLKLAYFDVKFGVRLKLMKILEDPKFMKKLKDLLPSKTHNLNAG